MAPEDATTALAHGEYRADVARRGAGLRLLERSGRALTETWPAGEKPPLSAGLVLAPWPNRTRDGEFAFGGTTHRLEITEAARNNASHGLVRRRDWDVVDRTDSSVTHAIEVGGEPGWPFPLRLTVRHALADDGLTVTHTATNLGDTEAPFGLGVHAFARAGDAPLDECTLHLSAGVRLPLDPERNLPAGGPVPVAGTTPTSPRRGASRACGSTPRSARWCRTPTGGRASTSRRPTARPRSCGPTHGSRGCRSSRPTPRTIRRIRIAAGRSRSSP